MKRMILVAAAVLVLAPIAPAGGKAGGKRGGPNVYIVDNAFVRDVQRPTVIVRRGRSVTWNWRSRQSHSVSVRSGPERFTAKTRNRGTFTHRFTKIGTYRMECVLHAPGMKMKVIVRR